MSAKVAIVIPWFGKELKGGAEQQAWQIANRLQASGNQVEILTTCSRSFLHSWDTNFYRKGVYHEGPLTIRRFKLRPRNKHLFNYVVGKMLAISKEQLRPGFFPLSRAEEEAYWQNNIGSDELIDYIATSQRDYDAFLFLPYLFPTSFLGVKAAGAKAFLQPCLHDEVYAYLRGSVEMMATCKTLLFNSPGEESLARDLYGDSIAAKAMTIGEGVEYETPSGSSLVDGPYFLVLGRRCFEKNTHLAIEAFQLFRQKTNADIKLVVAGPEEIPVAYSDPNIVDLGLVGAKEKDILLRDALALVNLSVNESFSRVLYESWLARHAVIVNKACRATYQALDASAGAGLGAVDAIEASAAMAMVAQEAASGHWQKRGELGAKYAQTICDWDEVVKRYAKCFAQERSEKKAIFVYSLADACETTLTDLLKLRADYERAGVKVQVLSPSYDFKGEHWSKAPTEPWEFHFDFVIWFGHLAHTQSLEFMRSFRGKKLLRVLTPIAPDPELVSSGFTDFGVEQLVPQFPLSYLQMERVSFSDISFSDTQTAKLFVYANLKSSESRVRLQSILNFFVKRYSFNLDLSFGIEDRTEAEHVAAFKMPGVVNVTAVYLQLGSSAFSTAYTLADSVLIFDNPKVKPWFVLAAKGYFLPIALIDSPFWQPLVKNSSIDSEQGKDLARAAAAIKLASEVVRRNELNSEDFSLSYYLNQAISFGVP